MAPCFPFQDVFQRSTSPNQERKVGRTVCVHRMPHQQAWEFQSDTALLTKDWSESEVATQPRRMGLHGLARNSSKLVTSRQSEPLRAHAVFQKGLQSPSFAKRSVHRRCTTRGIYTMAGKQTAHLQLALSSTSRTCVCSQHQQAVGVQSLWLSRGNGLY